ncbi:MAG: 50S ribosomal protein L4 [bacterium]
MATKVNVYNLKGDVTGSVNLPEIFEIEPNEDLLSQYVRVYLANQRQGTRDTKDRSEVSGKARKPWKQKGSGNARHGSRKAPSWRGGGVAHGPKPQNFSLKMSKSMKFSALISAYAKQKENCVILENADLEEVKTKSVSEFIKKAGFAKNVLFITADVQKNLVMSSRNISIVKVSNAAVINAYDLLKYRNIVIEKKVLEMMQDATGVTEETSVEVKKVKKESTKK